MMRIGQKFPSEFQFRCISMSPTQAGQLSDCRIVVNISKRKDNNSTEITLFIIDISGAQGDLHS